MYAVCIVRRYRIALQRKHNRSRSIPAYSTAQHAQRRAALYQYTFEYLGADTLNSRTISSAFSRLRLLERYTSALHGTPMLTLFSSDIYSEGDLPVVFLRRTSAKDSAAWGGSISAIKYVPRTWYQCLSCEIRGVQMYN